MGRLDGRVAIVTGAARGIGRAIAQAYDAEGARTVLVDIDGAGARATAARLRDAVGVEGDVGDEPRVTAIVEEEVPCWMLRGRGCGPPCRRPRTSSRSRPRSWQAPGM